MHNLRMAEKLEDGDAVDVSDWPREGDYYIAPGIPEDYRRGLDYCVARDEVWIWSIGQRLADGVILVSRQSDLYQNPAFDCLWLR